MTLVKLCLTRASTEKIIGLGLCIFECNNNSVNTVVVTFFFFTKMIFGWFTCCRYRLIGFLHYSADSDYRFKNRLCPSFHN